MAKLRAARAGSAAEAWLRPFAGQGYEAELSALVSQALKMEDPLQAELFLERSRWDWLNAATALDPFGTDAVIAYGLKILISERLSRFRQEAGEAEYKRVYAAVLGAAAQDGVA